MYFILYFQNTFFKYFVIFKKTFFENTFCKCQTKGKLISDRDPQLSMSLSCRSAVQKYFILKSILKILFYFVFSKYFLGVFCTSLNIYFPLTEESARWVSGILGLAIINFLIETAHQTCGAAPGNRNCKSEALIGIRNCMQRVDFLH